MRLLRLLAVPLLATSLLAACGDDDDDDAATDDDTETTEGEGGEDTGKVTVFSAMEPEEVAALEEAVAEAMADIEYEVEF